MPRAELREVNGYRLSEGETSTGSGYLLSRNILPIEQVCVRCGARVFVRQWHENWHSELDALLNKLKATTPKENP